MTCKECLIIDMSDQPTHMVLRRMPKSFEASVFNHVRLALRRLGCPLRVEVPGHRGLDVILDKETWLCVYSNADDHPGLAWISFTGRDCLHVPVSWHLELYHRFAGLVMGAVLDAVDEVLAERLMHADA